MAEFTEVMRQLGRICANNFDECDICDLRLFCPSKTFLSKYVKSGRTEKLEEMVMKWAAEHPEPVYPTWYRWLIMMGAVGSVEDLFSDLQRPIPADIAEKLGIEPKEV